MTSDNRFRALELAVRTVVPQGGHPPERAGEVTHVAQVYYRWLEMPAAPARMQFTIATEGEPEMPLTVDSANAVAILTIQDDHGDDVAPPAGTIATATSSNTAVLTVGAGVPGADANGVANIQFPLTEVAEGTSDLSVTVTDANGNPLLGPDGSTPIPAPAAVTVTVKPGAPAAEVFTVPGN
jgi:hypothetical protein